MFNSGIFDSCDICVDVLADSIDSAGGRGKMVRYILRKRIRRAIGAMIYLFHEMFRECEEMREDNIRVQQGLPILGRYMTDPEYASIVWHSYYNGRDKKGWGGGLKEYAYLGMNLFHRVPQVKSVLNVGAMCAYMDYKLAREYPDTKFYGIDLSEDVQRLNKEHFALLNLHFLTGSVFDLDMKFDALIMIRTAKHFTKAEIKRIFNAGFKYILIVDIFGYCDTLKRMYNFDRDDTVLYGKGRAHNYPKLLKANGYKVMCQEVCKGEHPNRPDLYNIMVIGEGGKI